MEINEYLTHAIDVRNKVEAGTESQEWVRARVLEMVEAGFWNDSQIAAICGYARQTVPKMARGVVRPAERPAGGRLAPKVLDVLLELRGATSQGRKPNPSLLRQAIETGTSTKLIARLSGAPIGVVLYQQRKAKQEKEVASWLSRPVD